MLAISPRTLRRYIAEGHVPVRRLPSGHMRIRWEVIDALLGDESTMPRRLQRKVTARETGATMGSGAHRRSRRAVPRTRRLPLSHELAATPAFDTSPEALEEARANARSHALAIS
jgi:hypothetical protein